MDLIIFVGLQAAGKTTFRGLELPNHVVVSKDLMIGDRRTGVSKAVQQVRLIRGALSNGQSAVVDNTNVTLEERAELILLGREYSARVLGYHFKSTVEQSMARNLMRTGKACIPRVGILTKAKLFVAPTLAEGFDELYEVVWGPGKTFLKARVL
jgi:predicted kinase